MSADIRGNTAAEFVADSDLTPGEHLRAEIERLGLDQVKVSEATGVSRQSINNIINGRQPISRAMAGKLARLTGRSTYYWLRPSFPSAADTDAHIGDANVRPLGVGVLVNHQIVRAIKDGIIAIAPYSESNVQLASIDLTLGSYVLTTEGEKIDIAQRPSFVLKGGRTVVVTTLEKVEFPKDYFGRVGPMASLAINGLIVSHGFQVDPGFVGHLSFCIFNAGGKDFELRPGLPVISLEIMPLNVSPAPDARADKHLSEAGDDEKVVQLYRAGASERMIRRAILDYVKVDTHNGEVKARIAELSLELKHASSADIARDEIVQSVLNGLKVLRDRPNTSRNISQKYLAFFGEVIDGLNLNADETRRIIATLGLPLDGGNPLILPLRDGGEAMLHLPDTTTISFASVAEALHEDPVDLLLLLVGLSDY